MHKRIARDKRLTASALLLLLVALLFVGAYFLINLAIRQRARGRMEEGVNTVVQEVSNKFGRDSDLLNATAKVISLTDNLDVDATRRIMTMFSPLLETMRIRVLMKDNQIITAEGEVFDAGETSNLRFEDVAPLGEHVSSREMSTSGRFLLRHFVPLIQNGETVAMLYGVTYLDTLPDTININNIYNAKAAISIIDIRNGDFIVDTRSTHPTLGNLSDYSADTPGRRTKGNRTWDFYMADILAGNTGYAIYRTDETDGWQYMYYAPMETESVVGEQNTWSVVVDVPEREAFSSVYAVRQIGLIIGAIFVAGVIAYCLYLGSQTRKITSEAVERAVLEERLHKAEAAERAKTTFLSNMSHDIRTPMNAILGFATLAETNLDDKDRVREYLKKILSSGNHLLSLINDILDMSRIESGKLNIEEKPCSISDIFRDMRNIIQTQMKGKQLNFYMDTLDVVDEDIFCDKLHVNQVLLNLLSNAIKFTPAGGTISLTICQKSGAPTGYGSYEIRVKDSGIGMSEEFAQHIFEPFERERTSTVSGIQGTGLGMAITKNIVDTMGGTISLKTEQGKGTEFTIRLQFRLQSERKHVEVIREIAGLRALVVDDNFDTCDSVSKMLTQIGMRSEWTMYGKEAVLRAQQASEMGDGFAVYIIDWVMPDLSGFEIVRRIRKIVGEEVPIIIITAYDVSAVMEEAKEVGVTAYCNKPIFLSELRDTLVSAVGKEKKPPEEPIALDRTQFEGKRILLVEDNELNLEIAEELLTESGFSVETAKNGAEALERVSSSEPGYYDLVLMDIQMPVMDGYAATRAIRALENRALAGVPIVAMTANAFEEDRRLAAECGMNAHVAKPIDVEQLTQTLKRLLLDKTED